MMKMMVLLVLGRMVLCLNGSYLLVANKKLLNISRNNLRCSFHLLVLCTLLLKRKLFLLLVMIEKSKKLILYKEISMLEI